MIMVIILNSLQLKDYLPNSYENDKKYLKEARLLRYDIAEHTQMNLSLIVLTDV